MFIKLKSDVVINTKYIIAIEPYEGDHKNSGGDKITHLLYMVDCDQCQWYLTEEDYHSISESVCLQEKKNG